VTHHEEADHQHLFRLLVDSQGDYAAIQQREGDEEVDEGIAPMLAD
jgi:hypothetical protein